MNLGKPTLTLSGTYTLDPVADVIEYWIEYLDLDLATCVTAYAQLFQQLLDPSSALRRNQAGANSILLRWADLIPQGAESPAVGLTWSEVEPRVSELAAALTSFRHELPCLVLVGPSDCEDLVLERACAELESKLVGTPNLFVERGERAMARYDVVQVHDPVSNRFGHVPFTSHAITALGTTVARWYAALVRSPVKIVAVDGDHTLWSGVVAEDGVQGVHMGEPHLALQQKLVEQNDSGRLVCLLSKNEESDVRDLFETRPEMPLRWSHFISRRIDWNPKPDNIKSIVAELELGLDSVVFLDDSPVECAQMRACCPGVTTVRVPTDPAQLTSFTDHLWLFDQPKVTTEDRNRAMMYRENSSRAELRRNTDSLQLFLSSLDLVVEISPISDAELPRIAQLTQRTNQFNASLIRCNETDVRHSLAVGGVFHCFVRARDRFGDYGIVGQVRARPGESRLEVDLFMLSCRALGRGIEHQMLNAVGKHAISQGLDEVAVLFRRGDRNAPARRFLEGVFKTQATSDEQWFVLGASPVADLVFDALATMEENDASEQAGQRLAPESNERPDIGARYEHIAHGLTSGAQIELAMASRVRPRPDLASGFIVPAAGLEREIALIWQEVLRVEAVGVHDRFHDLGGKSIHLVQVHRLLLDRLKVEVDITMMFEHATVSSLAARLSEQSQGTVTAAARARGIKMREARGRPTVLEKKNGR